MRFIGIISVKDYNKIESELYKKLDEKDYNIIFDYLYFINFLQ